MTDRVHTVAELLAPEQASKFSPQWMQENVLNPAINAGPLGVYNTAANLASLPEVHLKTGEAKPYSTEWFAQGLSSGIGAAVPFMIAGAAAGSAMRATDRGLAGTALGNALNPYLTSERYASIAGASIYGALQKPDEHHTRLGNAIGMGVGVAVFSKGNDMIKGLAPLQKALAYPAVGFIGGGVMTEASQFFSNGKLASNDAALQGAVQGMTMNTVMGVTADYVTRKVTESQKAAEQARYDTARSIMERQMDPNKVRLDQLPAESKSAFAEIARIQREYSDFLKDNKVQYPHPEDFHKLTQDEIVKLGFEHPDRSLDVLQAFKGDKKPRPLPDAKVVAAEVAKITDKMPNAGTTGDLRIGEWNMEFLTADKARYFADTYKQIVPKHHLLFVEEVNTEGLKQVAKDTGYNYAISAENSRGQAVGFLIHPRLKITGTESIDAVANVHNIPDLRPAFKVDVTDATSGDSFSGVVVHLKSMRGGPEQTAPVRTLQAEILARELGPNFKGIIAGDWNTFLDKTTELNALKNAGFAIHNPNDTSSTQAMGGRLDGFLHRGLSGKLGDQYTNPFFKNPLITRGLSDHALLTTSLSVGK